ncbi:MAG: hypothetical protein ABID38_01710 [Candidatus Diapherotrites archaeon]
MMFRKFIVGILLISIIAYGAADTYRVTITPSGTPACTIGTQITAECVCNGSTYTSGYCCAAGYQTSSCTLPTCTDQAQATVSCSCGSDTCSSGEYCCTGTCQAGTCTAACVETNDLTGDGEVNVLDLIMAATRGDLAYYDATGDANCDGVVDISDVILVANNYT